MYTKTQSRFFPKLLTALLTGSLLLSACAPAPTATNLPTNTMIPATGDPTQIPVSPTPVLATEVPATAIPTAQPPSSTGTAVTFGSLTLRRAAGSSQRSERQ